LATTRAKSAKKASSKATKRAAPQRSVGGGDPAVERRLTNLERKVRKLDSAVFPGERSLIK
jgi:hypothetical protein